MISVRKFRAHEAELLRGIRLDALRDSPETFASSLQDEQDLPLKHWTDIVQRHGRRRESQSFVAEEDGRALAMAACFPETADSYRLIAMWVAPSARGKGIGRALVEAIAGWARHEGAGELIALVYAHNIPAINLYRKLGFVLQNNGEINDASHAPDEELRYAKALTVAP